MSTTQPVSRRNVLKWGGLAAAGIVGVGLGFGGDLLLRPNTTDNKYRDEHCYTDSNRADSNLYGYSSRNNSNHYDFWFSNNSYQEHNGNRE